MSDRCAKLLEAIREIPIVDTHEHLPGRESERTRDNDVLGEYLTHYFSCDLVSAGLTPADLNVARDPGRPLDERWKLIAPYWDAARNTGYGRSLDLAARGIYGIARIDGDTIGELNEKFQAARAAGGHFKRVLGELSGIAVSVTDSHPDADTDLFRSTCRVDSLIDINGTGRLAGLAKEAGMDAIHSLADLEDAVEKIIDARFARPAVVCLKCGLAYQRALHFPKTSRADAERGFAELFADAGPTDPTGGRTLYRRQLADYMMHHVCRVADARGLTFQIHTGIQEGNGNYVVHSDPVLLTNLFMEYANIKFDLFHIGYPKQQAVASLAKNFRNVYIDFCWAHIISPTASVRAMVEYLDSVPANKISGFGGDYCFVDGVYGHQVLARQNIARALDERIAAGACDFDEAVRLATWMLHDNPARLLGLDG